VKLYSLGQDSCEFHLDTRQIVVFDVMQVERAIYRVGAEWARVEIGFNVAQHTGQKGACESQVGGGAEDTADSHPPSLCVNSPVLGPYPFCVRSRLSAIRNLHISLGKEILKVVQ
jgi:hypothetical protein